MNDSEDILIVEETESGIRLDRFLATRYKEVRSRSYFQFLIGEGAVLLNGKQVKKRAQVAGGDEVQVEFVLTPETEVAAEKIPLDILWEDEHLLIINKSAGIVVHPAPGNWTGTLANALLYHCKGLESEFPLRPGIVHRLDKDTSGALVMAKTIAAHQGLVALFAERNVRKEYVAVCIGNPGSGVAQQPIGRDLRDRKKMVCSKEGGRSAVTHYETVAQKGDLALVHLLLETGRTHQIRVHLQDLNCPILGDGVYGSDRMNRRHGASRQMLHAARLSFSHPITGQLLDVAASIPQDMAQLIERAGLL